MARERRELESERELFNQEKGNVEQERDVVQAHLANLRVRIDHLKKETIRSQETLLREQHATLAHVLAEQERLREERIAFGVQRDRDVLKLRAEAATLDKRIRAVNGAFSILSHSMRTIVQNL